MPELPEVESVRLSLLPHVRGQIVAGVDVRRADVVSRGGVPRTGVRPGAVREGLLVGSRVAAVLRRGKQLAIVTGETADARAVVVQLGMSGQLFALQPGAHLPNASHVHVVWRLESGARLVFRDARRFGGVTVLHDRAALDERWSQLGPDALTIHGDQLAERLHATRRAIKAALLDQGLLAGVGNIYADESLFRAGISPRTPANRLTPLRIARLAGAIREVLQEAVAAGGSSLADGTYVDAEGNPGNFQLRHAVYGRGGEACRVCGKKLREGAILNRTTVWCAGCQRAG
jgi:formamidopyrimidine-DNA glycosylase